MRKEEILEVGMEKLPAIPEGTYQIVSISFYGEPLGIKTHLAIEAEVNWKPDSSWQNEQGRMYGEIKFRHQERPRNGEQWGVPVFPQDTWLSENTTLKVRTTCGYTGNDRSCYLVFEIQFPSFATEHPRMAYREPLRLRFYTNHRLE